VFGFLGPNGAGKTTTLEMIEGLRKPDAGTIRLLDRPVWPDPRAIQKQIGVQLQSTTLFDMLSARELLVLFGNFYECPDPGDRAARVLELVGLEARAEEYAKNLSGGQQQRLAIALALVHEPEIVFLDEPTTGLDPQARRNLWDVIRAINIDQGKTVVLTTHYLEEAEELCRRVAIMDSAEIVALDTPAGLIATLDADARVSYSDPSGDHVVYSRDAQATVLELLDQARDSGATVSGLSVRGADLEDVFLHLTGREYRE
jgi:ABC-2 type transport system ATP-binding protein